MLMQRRNYKIKGNPFEGERGPQVEHRRAQFNSIAGRSDTAYYFLEVTLAAVMLAAVAFLPVSRLELSSAQDPRARMSARTLNVKNLVVVAQTYIALAAAPIIYPSCYRSCNSKAIMPTATATNTPGKGHDDSRQHLFGQICCQSVATTTGAGARLVQSLRGGERPPEPSIAG